MLDRLMGRAVLPVAHGVVREDVDSWQLHQGGEPDRGPNVVAEDEEGRAKRPQLRQRQPVHDRPHRVLANAEVQIPAARGGGLEIAGAGERERGLVRRTEVRRAAEEPWDVLREDVQDFARGLPPRHTLWIGREHREVPIPALRQLSAAVSDRSRSQGPGTWSGTRRTVPSMCDERRRSASPDRRRSARALRPERETSRPPASRTRASSGGFPRHRAARRGRRRCLVCWASRTRCCCRGRSTSACPWSV